MPTDEEISDFLIIISVIAKRLAGLIMKEGERQDEQNEELSMLLDNLIECGETLTETARALKAFYSSDNEPSAAPAKPLPPTEEPAAPEAKRLNLNQRKRIQRKRSELCLQQKPMRQTASIKWMSETWSESTATVEALPM